MFYTGKRVPSVDEFLDNFPTRPCAPFLPERYCIICRRLNSAVYGWCREDVIPEGVSSSRKSSASAAQALEDDEPSFSFIPDEPSSQQSIEAFSNFSQPSTASQNEEVDDEPLLEFAPYSDDDSDVVFTPTGPAAPAEDEVIFRPIAQRAGMSGPAPSTPVNVQTAELIAPPQEAVASEPSGKEVTFKMAEPKTSRILPKDRSIPTPRLKVKEPGSSKAPAQVDFMRPASDIGKDEVSFKPAEESSGDVSFKPAEESSGDVAFKPAEESVDEVAFKPAEESSGDVSFKPAEESVDNVSFKPAEESVDEVAFKPAEESSGDVSFKPAEESEDEIFEEEKAKDEKKPKLTLKSKLAPKPKPKLTPKPKLAPKPKSKLTPKPKSKLVPKPKSKLVPKPKSKLTPKPKVVEKDEEKQEKGDDGLFECPICDTKVSSEATICPNCGAVFEE